MDDNKPLPIRQVTKIERVVLRPRKGGNPDAVANRKFPRKTPCDAPRQRTLSRMQQIFVDNMLAGKTYRESARAAGYAESVIATSGLMTTKGPVREALARAAEQNFQEAKIENKRVINEAAALAFSNIDNFIIVDEATGNFKVDLRRATKAQKAAIQDLSYDANGRPRIKLYDKTSSLALLGRFLQMFTSKVEISGAGGQPLTIQYLDKVIQQISIQSTDQITQGQVIEGNVLEAHVEG